MASVVLRMHDLLPLLLLLSLPASQLLEARSNDGYCCLPEKWHARLLLTSHRRLAFPTEGGGAPSAEAEPLTRRLEAYVSYRRPRFELRAVSGGSLVYWRGHMWQFGGGQPRLLNRVPAPGGANRPSGGLAPLLFRCLAPRHGFQRVNASHYRLTEADPSKTGRRLGLATVTDVFVRDGGGSRRRRSRRRRLRRRGACQLEAFSVRSRYLRPVAGRGVAIATDTDAYAAEGSARARWPDRLLTERARLSLGHYRHLMRSGVLGTSSAA